MTPSKLAQARSGAAPTPSRFAQALAGARVLHDFTIPGLNVPAVMTLVSHDVAQTIEAAVWTRMREIGLELNTTTEGNYEGERAKRVLAEAVLDPDAVRAGNYTTRFGTLDEWGAVHTDVLAECWRIYGALREANDPLSVPLTQSQLDMITDAVKKKQDRLLRYFGARALSSWLVTMADQLASSLLPQSGPSEPSEETSIPDSDQSPPY